MRDSNRKKVYAAEDVLEQASEKYPDMEQMKAFVAKVTKNAFLLKRYGGELQAPIYIGDGRARRRAGGNQFGIYMPKWSRKDYIILHELAHCISHRKYKRDSIAGHGVEFRMIYLDLVQAMLGLTERKMLEGSFKKHNLRFKPKRELSPERLEQLRQRGRELAAARMQKK